MIGYSRRVARKTARAAGARGRPVRPIRAPRRWTAGPVRRIGRADAGAAAVEWALILPALLAFTLGVVEMGRLLFAYNAISQAAMEGARYAIVRGATSAAPASETDIVAFVMGQVTGLDPADVSVAASWDPNNQPGNPVTVQVDYAFDFLALDVSPVSLSRASTMTISR